MNAGGTDDDDCAWEQSGAVRRDCVSHRGELLSPVAVVGLGLAFLCLCCPPIGVLGVALCLWVRRAAGHDLGQMREGFMDPAGEFPTRVALANARAGIALGCVGALVVWAAAAVWGLSYWLWFS